MEAHGGESTYGQLTAAGGIDIISRIRNQFKFNQINLFPEVKAESGKLEGDYLAGPASPAF